MSTNAYLSNILFQLVVTGSPTTYVEIEEVLEPPSVGETAPLVDVTHTQSTSREYIGGLADGDEFSCTCNRVISSPSGQNQLIALKGLTRTFRVTSKDTSESPNATSSYTFDAVILGWSIQPAVGEQDKIAFSFKISGGVAIS